MSESNEQIVDNSFHILQEKSVPIAIQCISCSPKMDLIVIVFIDCSISVHRLSWERIYNLQPNKEFKDKNIKPICISWPLNGKYFTIGYSNSSITVHDIENKLPLIHTNFNNLIMNEINEKIQSIHWTSLPSSSSSSSLSSSSISSSNSSSNIIFPSPPTIITQSSRQTTHATKFPIPLTFSSFNNNNNNNNNNNYNNNNNNNNLLVSTNENGSIMIHFSGSFELASLSNLMNDDDDDDDDNSNLLHARFNSNSESLFLITTSSSSSSSSNLALNLLQVPTPIISNNVHQLELSFRSLSNLDQLLNYINVSVSSLSSSWKEKGLSFHGQMQKLQQMLDDQSADSTPLEEFFQFIASGTCSTAMNQFLTESLGQSGIIKLDKSMLSACITLQESTLSQLQPALEQIILITHNLKSFATYSSQFKDLGLNFNQLSTLELFAHQLLIASESFLRELSETKTNYSLFFKWLLQATNMLLEEDDDPSTLQITSPSDSSSSSTHTLLCGSLLTPIGSTSNLQKLVEPATFLDKILSPNLISRHLTDTNEGDHFPSLISSMANSLKDIIKSMNQSISASLKQQTLKAISLPITTIENFESTKPTNLIIDTINSSSSNSILYLFAAAESNSFMIYEPSRDQKLIQIQLPQPNQTIASLGFYSDSSVILLTCQGQLLQFSNLHHYLTTHTQQQGNIDSLILEPEHQRQLQLNDSHKICSLDVCGTRRVVCITISMKEGQGAKRVIVLDMDTHDNEEDDEDEDDEEDDDA